MQQFWQGSQNKQTEGGPTQDSEQNLEKEHKHTGVINQEENQDNFSRDQDVQTIGQSLDEKKSIQKDKQVVRSTENSESSDNTFYNSFILPSINANKETAHEILNCLERDVVASSKDFRNGKTEDGKTCQNLTKRDDPSTPST